MRATQDAGPVGNELRSNLLVQHLHLGPVYLRVPVVLLVVAIVEPEEVVEPVIRAYGVGEIVARLATVVLQVALGVAEGPSQIIGGKVEKREVPPIDPKH